MSKLFEPLKRNVAFSEIIKPRWVLEPPNYTRTPLWRQFLEVQFTSRNFFVFGSTWAALASFGFLLWYSRLLDPPPLERLDRYWLNSPKFRILSAYYNSGKRPAAKIALMTYEVRYFNRGLDHPFTMNEVKDFLFKMKENYLIENHPGVQYPNVFRQHSNVKTPATLTVNLH
ncbi:conserved hypothetical protein [Theileria orientalis strain Shintoku]|uniref:Uncharacterized protein n=1 Tax=Theileria orientalis strain Shintoku TaxID=869250 RepID=J4D756_THEOR|nr:conserved hypothetical protein [Theileria orientalis strain Shintoku]PVC53042.1 hypothetical protein MACL_00000353 [Theileria orientalis]BAM39975.1 conserved hypothetical protein [Theileria orientalis strain Shintoku]|eukprot:XP_009690276.1 conserved hypothetical protein [Theileria orientalis strain Shintoku]